MATLEARRPPRCARWLRRGLVLALGCVVLASVAPARAQEREARELYERGSAAYAEGRHAEAVRLFRRSLDLAVNAGTAFELANALRHTGRIVEAVDVFAELLAGDFGELSREQRAEVQRLRQEARDALGTLQLVAQGPERASVRLDGARIGHLVGEEPLTRRVDPGEHVVELTAERYLPMERRVSIDPGATERVEVEMELDPAQALGRLILEAEEPGHTLEIVGVAEGAGRLERELEPGTYDLRVSDGERERETTVEVAGGSTLRVQLDLQAGGSVLSSPFFWLGSGLVAAGLAVGLVFLLAVDRNRDPIVDPIFGNTQTLLP